MSDVLELPRIRADASRDAPRLLGMFAAWRLRAYGSGIAIVYAVVMVHFYRGGGWIINRAGTPVYGDFTTCWVVGVQALHGNTAALYDSAEFLKIQAALLGARDFFYPNWPYPPTFSLFLAPFAMLPYFWAFLAWNFVTLLGCIIVVYLIVRRSPAIALVLASPFTAWNFLAGQNGFLTASLLGASLLFLERQPILAGVFMGCLTYKPQFGVLLPVALAAAKQGRAFASAVVTVALLVGASIAAFGVSPWEALPRGLLQQYGVVLLAEGQADAAADWGRLQTVYGLIRYLHGGGALAWVGQGVIASGAAIIVWLVWRSPMRYTLKAAILSAAVLLATPYAFSYDLAAIAIPVAFLAKDQLDRGLLKGEQTLMLALFGMTLSALVVFGDSPYRTTFGSMPLGTVVVIAFLGLQLRRAFRHHPAPTTPAFADE
jgi:hypothetical protein